MSAPVVNIPAPALPELPLPPDAYDIHRDAHTPLIIDNGSTHLRWGFATSDTPRWGTNLISKYKERRHNRPLVLFGDAVDVESGARAQARAAWEGDILLNFDALVSSMYLDVTRLIIRQCRKTRSIMLLSASVLMETV